MKNKSGFTIVELLIAIAVIVILSGIMLAGYRQVQVDSRDVTRSSNATIISEALEKYYEKNGAYPSVISLANSQPANTGAAIAAKLGIPEESLLMPDMPDSETNGIQSGASPSNDYIAYEGYSVTNNANCQSSATGGCEQFTLRYVEESSGGTVVIESRRDDVF